jgi:hypothetical protein
VTTTRYEISSSTYTMKYAINVIAIFDAGAFEAASAVVSTP